MTEIAGETMARAKAEFLKQFGKDYGYPDAPKDIDEIRASEFKRLQGLNSIPPPWVRFPETRKWFGFCAVSWTVFLKPWKGSSLEDLERFGFWSFWSIPGLVYLDHAGATLYSEAQIEAVAKDLTSSVYGNPRIQGIGEIPFL